MVLQRKCGFNQVIITNVFVVLHNLQKNKILHYLESKRRIDRKRKITYKGINTLAYCRIHIEVY